MRRRADADHFTVERYVFAEWCGGDQTGVGDVGGDGGRWGKGGYGVVVRISKVKFGRSLRRRLGLGICETHRGWLCGLCIRLRAF